MYKGGVGGFSTPGGGADTALCLDTPPKGLN